MFIKSIIYSILITSILFVAVGCEAVRFAPGQLQKQNTYLHHKTTLAARQTARNESSSVVLQALTAQAAQQSDAILAYYGLPKELPSINSIDELLSENNKSITAAAHAEAVQRPDLWQLADSVFELGVGLAGLLGGVFGTRVLVALKTARQKSAALSEIVAGNELFKKQNSHATAGFKQAHQNQSKATKTIVAAIK